MPTVHLIIKGKVQGVFYRASAKEKADELGISGWVQNTREGNVEVMASGQQKNLDAFIAWCKKGPARAQVSGVDVTQKESEEVFTSFSIKRY